VVQFKAAITLVATAAIKQLIIALALSKFLVRFTEMIAVL
jgi:hypothetical protein